MFVGALLFDDFERFPLILIECPRTYPLSVTKFSDLGWPFW